MHTQLTLLSHIFLIIYRTSGWTVHLLSRKSNAGRPPFGTEERRRRPEGHGFIIKIIKCRLRDKSKIQFSRASWIAYWSAVPRLVQLLKTPRSRSCRLPTNLVIHSCNWTWSVTKWLRRYMVFYQVLSRKWQSRWHNQRIEATIPRAK